MRPPGAILAPGETIIATGNKILYMFFGVITLTYFDKKVFLFIKILM